MERRKFLQKGALAGAAAIVSSNAELAAQTNQASLSAPPAPPASPAQTTPIMTAAGEAIGPGEVQVIGENQRSGSDFMLDVLEAERLEHESIINYGGNHAPEMITC